MDRAIVAAGQVPQAGRPTHPNDPRLRGTRRMVARGAWVVLVAVNLLSFITGIPALFATIETVCPQACTFAPQQQAALANIGLSMDVYATLVVVLACLVLLISLAMGLLVFWRRSDDWMALIVAFFLVAVPIGNISALTESSGPPTDAMVIGLLLLLPSLPAVATYYGIFLIFPSGRFVPRWSWILLVAWVVFFIVVWNVQPTFLGGNVAFGYLLFYGSAIVFQIHRYRSVSSVIQRQQTKLVVVGFIASLLANQLFWQTGSLTPLRATLYGPLALVIYLLTLLLLPTTFFIAIQRYRLYDIDVLIRRTLIYGSVSLILALVYLGGIIGLQALLDGLAQARSGNGFSPPVIVVTTLVIAALFQPLRSRIQRAVDRRFYRSKYDAQRAIEAFGASLREQIDLPSLTRQLIMVVQETMQPEAISLWLAQKTARSADGTPPDLRPKVGSHALLVNQEGGNAGP
jgi:hypothetical protein